MHASWFDFSASIFLNAIFCGWWQPHRSRNRKSVEAAESEGLAREIWENIFQRLPVKSLGKCICVCKAWKSIITKQSFILAHLDHRKANSGNDEPFFLQYKFLEHPHQDHSIFCGLPCRLFPSQEKIKSEQFLSVRSHDKEASCLAIITTSRLRDEIKRDLDVVGTCNGLVCIVKYSESSWHDRFIIMNLSIRKFIVLPEIYASLGTLLPEHLSLYGGHIMFGFGFDSRNKDFKVVVLVPGWSKNPLLAPVEVYVYSLASGQWRSIKDGVPSIYSCSHLSSKRSLTFVNGALNWVFCGKCNNQRRPSFISTFDLAEETFGETMLPNCWDDESCFDPSLLVRGSCLALAYQKKDPEGSDVMYIWVMKEYGDVDSWNLVRCVNLRHYPRIQRIIALRRSEEMVVKVIGGMLFLLDNDLEKPKAAKDLELRQYEVGFAADHVESLFLIKQKYKSYVKDFVDVRFVSPK